MNPSSLALYVPVTKIDEEKQEVWGVIAEEAPDRTGEILDYARSKPYFEEWSETQKAASGGKSLGNVRLMHGKIAIGKLTQVDFNDEKKLVSVCAKITNRRAFEDAKEGVLTGFSIGGSYVGSREEVDDPKYGKLLRYVGRPQEVSLVDRPAMPGATFSIVKADGSEETKKFVGRQVAQVWSCGAPGHEHVSKSAALNCLGDDACHKCGADEWDAEKCVSCGVEKRDFSQKQRDRAAATGAALPDGSYPIQNTSDLKNAIQAYGRAKNKAKVKAHIIARAKALGAMSELPAGWGKADGGELRKSLYDVGDLAGAVLAVNRVRLCSEAEAAYEGDGSSMPEILRHVLALLCEALVQMTEEETSELIADFPSDDDGAEEPGTDSSPDLTDLPGIVVQYGTAVRTDVEKLIAERVSKTSRERGVELLERAAAALKTMGDSAQEDPMDEKTLEKFFTAQNEALKKSIDDATKPIVDRLEKAEKETADLKAKLEATPAPAKAALHAVEKGDDTKAADGNPLDGALTPETFAKASSNDLMKRAMRRPFVVPGSALGR